ncbi:MAG: type II toxin-antitoxin system RelE/ParE family toxin [Bacteroidales bacterium]|nr:type II toxin-antitoxin system RelE/ParE family toxin [Bacteroidales bacterium]
MNCNIITTKGFAKQLKRLAKRYKSIKDDVRSLVDELIEEPFSGISLGQNIYKIRMPISSKGGGKSGGARVIYHTVIIEKNGADITLLTIYDKSEQENISDTDIKKLIKDNGL